LLTLLTSLESGLASLKDFLKPSLQQIITSIRQILKQNHSITNKQNNPYKKTKKAVGGRLGMLGSLTFFPFPTLAFFAIGSLDLGFFLHI